MHNCIVATRSLANWATLTRLCRYYSNSDVLAAALRDERVPVPVSGVPEIGVPAPMEMDAFLTSGGDGIGGETMPDASLVKCRLSQG